MAASTKAELKELYILSSSKTVFTHPGAPFAVVKRFDKTSEKTKAAGARHFKKIVR